MWAKPHHLMWRQRPVVKIRELLWCLESHFYVDEIERKTLALLSLVAVSLIPQIVKSHEFHVCYDVDGLVQDLSFNIVKAPPRSLTVTVAVRLEVVCNPLIVWFELCWFSYETNPSYSSAGKDINRFAHFFGEIAQKSLVQTTWILVLAQGGTSQFGDDDAKAEAEVSLCLPCADTSTSSPMWQEDTAPKLGKFMLSWKSDS